VGIIRFWALDPLFESALLERPGVGTKPTRLIVHVATLPPLYRPLNRAYELEMDRTDYRYNSEYRATVRAQMIVLANGLIAGDLGLIAVARKLSSFRDGVEPEIGALLDVFVGIHSETDALPIEEERALWNAEALAREDRKISAAEERWRQRAVRAATQLVPLLKQNS
jgi:hypothetical protein